MFIELTRGLKTVVDEEDYEELSKYSWQAQVNSGRNPFSYYAVRQDWRVF